MGDNDSLEGTGEGLSAVTGIERGSNNKRKCLSDSSVDMMIDESGSSLTEFPRYELLKEKLENSFHGSGSSAERYKNKVLDKEVRGFKLDDWNDPTAGELEEILTNNLLQIFSCALKKIVECGYKEEVAGWAVLNSGLCRGSKDGLSNVMDGALAFLEKEKESNIPNKPIHGGFESVAPYFVSEMIHVIISARPNMTLTEAMWCLLLNDMNLTKACMVEEISICGSFGQQVSVTAHPSFKEPENQSLPNSQDSCKKYPVSDPIHQFPNSKTNPGSVSIQEVREQLCLARDHVRTSAKVAVVDEKSGSGRKVSLGDSNEDMPQQKAFHFEKGCKGHTSQDGFKSNITAWGNMVLKNSLKSQSNLLKKISEARLSTSAGTDGSVTEGSHCSLTNSQSGTPATALLVKNTFSASPEVKSETLVPSLQDPQSHPESEIHVSGDSEATDYYAEIPYDETLQKYVPQDEKDESILSLVPHKEVLENEIEYWMDWANEKVMQAARRLANDRGELKMLRQEKEEAEKLNKERQTMEDSANKRFSEMETALCKTAGEIELSNFSIRRFEEDNSVLKEKLEAYKVQALEAARNLHEAMLRLQEASKKSQSLDSEKGLFLSELTGFKREVTELNDRLDKMKVRQEQVKVLWKQEEKEKLEAATQYESLRSKRENADALAEEEENNIKNMAEMNMQKCKYDIKNLENVISELRSKSEKSKIAALSVGYGSCLEGSEDLSASQGLQFLKNTKRLPVFQKNFATGSLKPERECVMCMVEEISVVLLPCAHQNLCEKCSVIHEKLGRNECPSCRTTIQKRIGVRYRQV